MAKKQGAGGTSSVTVRSLSSGPRDYPLKDGSSIYLPSKGKGIQWPVIPAEQVSEALLAAEKKGTIELIGKTETSTPVEAPPVETPKEASE